MTREGTERGQEAPFKPLPFASQIMLITFKLQSNQNSSQDPSLHPGQQGLRPPASLRARPPSSPVPSSLCDIFAHRMHAHAELSRHP